MEEQKDPLIQQLFADAHQQLEGEEFTAQVMQRSRRQRIWTLVPWALLICVLALGGWYFFSASLLALTQLIVQAMTIQLLDLGTHWLAWFLAPVNNIGSLLVLGFKLFRIFRKRVMQISYV